MLNSLHHKLSNKFRIYRDWHSSNTSSITNAFLFFVFCLYISGVTWLMANPSFLRESEELKVLGAQVGPSNLAHEMDRNKLSVDPVITNGEFLVVVTTTRDSQVWVEYDDVVDGMLYKTERTPFGMTHMVNLWGNDDLNSYAYRIGAKDRSGYTIYSQVFFWGE